MEIIDKWIYIVLILLFTNDNYVNETIRRSRGNDDNQNRYDIRKVIHDENEKKTGERKQNELKKKPSILHSHVGIVDYWSVALPRAYQTREFRSQETRKVLANGLRRRL